MQQRAAVRPHHSLRLTRARDELLLLHEQQEGRMEGWEREGEGVVEKVRGSEELKGRGRERDREWREAGEEEEKERDGGMERTGGVKLMHFPVLHYLSQQRDWASRDGCGSWEWKSSLMIGARVGFTEIWEIFGTATCHLTWHIGFGLSCCHTLTP